MWRVTGAWGRRGMLVRWTGSPLTSCDRLDGVVYGVNASFAALGYGTELRNTRGPDGPSTPCDSSRIGLLFTTRQISSPCAGRLSSLPFLAWFSSRKYSLPSGRTSTLKHSFVLPSIGARISFCLTVGSMTAGLTQSSCSFDQAQKCCGLPLPTWLDIAHQTPTPSEPGFSGRAYRSGRPRMWPNSWQNTLMFAIRSPPSPTLKYGQRLPLWLNVARRGQQRLPPGTLTPPPAAQNNN